MFKHAFLLLFLGTISMSSSHAQNFMIHDSEKNCSTIMKYKEMSKKSAEPFYKKLMGLFKSNSLKIVTKKLKTKTQYYVDKDKLRNYVFLYKPLKSGDVLDRHRGELKNIMNQISIQDKNIEKLVESKSIAECRSLYDQFPVDENYYNNLKKSLKNNKLALDSVGSEIVLNSILELEEEESLYNSWTILYQTELNSLQEILNSPDTGSVVIVSHVSERGQLFDSRGRGIPREIFKKVSPSIHSINFYSCFGEKLLDFYKLGNNTQKRSSAHKRLDISYAKQNMNNDKLSPHLFKKYFSKIDFKGATRLQKLSLDSDIKDISFKKCELKINTNDKSADYFVMLNDYFIANPTHNRNIYSFPCYYLDKDKGNNIVRAYKGSGKDFSKIQFSIEVDNPIIEEYFYRTDGAFQGAFLNF